MEKPNNNISKIEKVERPSQYDIKMDTFCVAPFVHQSTKTDGSVKACCRAKGRIASVQDLYGVQGTDLVDAWNWRKLRELRLDLTTGVKNDMCKICWDHEDNGVQSMRQNINANSARMKEAKKRALIALQDNGILDETKYKPTYFEFKLNNNCNLKCRMCSPVDSSSWFKDHKLIKHIKSNFGETYDEYVRDLGLEDKALLSLYNEENFWNNLEFWTEQADRFQFAGGEPLYDKDHYRVLESLKNSNKDLSKITLDYATNLTVLETKNYNVLDYWKDYQEVVVGFSIDGPPGINEYIRGGSNINNIKENIIKLQNNLNNVTLKAKFTVQALNIYYLPELTDWLLNLGIKSFASSYVSFPDHLDAKIWNAEARENIIEQYEKSINRMSNDNTSAKNNLKSILNYFKSGNLYTKERWDRFIEWNKILDKSRNESYNDYKFLERYMNYER